MAIEESFRLVWAKGINSVSGRALQGVHGWLNTETYAVQPGASPDIVQLIGVDPPRLAAAFAFDLNRLSSCARESLFAIPPLATHPKSTGWLLVTLYYAAFFYAHALLRVGGRAVLFFEVSDLLQLRKVARTYLGATTGLFNRGQYFATTWKTGLGMELERYRGGGGVHEIFWSVVLDNFAATKAIVSASPILTSAQKAEFSTRIDEIQTAMCRNNHPRGNWLSHMRNDINYRQARGVWFPYSTHLTVETLRNRIDTAVRGRLTLRELNLAAHDDVTCFVDACLAFVLLARSVLADLEARCTQGTSFLKYGSSSLEEAQRAAVAAQAS